MTRYVAMIPARLGSQRVKKKNLRLLGDQPLVAHVGQTAVASGVFDAVYINSEAEVFEGIARQLGAQFYRRPSELATDGATNDQFALDFMNAVPCDVLVQINPTSPFLGVEDLRRAKEMFERDGYDTVLSVRECRVEGVCRGRPINFEPTGQMPPSQLLEPIMVFCNGILAWRTSVFRDNMRQRGCAVYGGKGRTGYCVLKGDATLDIDSEEDFALAELLLERVAQGPRPVRYWNALAVMREHAETEVSGILTRDGVEVIDLQDVNRPVRHLPDVLAKADRTRSWSKRIINSASNCVTLVSQMPGEGNRRHYHKDWDEWWLILEGEWSYEVDGVSGTVRQGDVVFIERHRVHRVVAKGTSRAVRMAVSRDGVAHIYPQDAPQRSAALTHEIG